MTSIKLTNLFNMSIQSLTLSDKISWSSPAANDDDEVNDLIQRAKAVWIDEKIKGIAEAKL